MSELESFLNDEPVTEATETPAEPEATEQETTAETEEVTEEVAEPEGSPAEPEKDEKIPLAALMAEREKRQLYEKQLQEAQQKIAKFEEAPKPELNIPDPIDDGEGFQSSVKQAFESIPEQVNSAVQQRLDQASFRRAERKYGDEFQEKIALANEYLNQNPQIQLPGDDIVEEAFEVYEKHLEVQQWQDPDFVAKKEAEIEQRLLEKLSKQQTETADKEAAKQKLAETLTPSLAAARANGANKPVVDIPDPMQTTFNR